MPRYRIHHRTRYTYKTPARESANRIILFPQPDSFQDVIKHEIKITNDPVVYTYTDYFGNTTGLFNLNIPHNEMIIDSMLTVLTHARPVPADDVSSDLQWNELLSKGNEQPYMDYLRQEIFSGSDEMKRMIDAIRFTNCSPFRMIQQLNEWVFKNFNYNKGITSVESSLDDIWKLRAGVCQDFAHVLLALLRMVRIPARYVSGYICPQDNKLRGVGATHAWVEAYIPYFGWLGIDPTNNCIANDKHVRIAVGRNYNDCSPVKGIYKGTQEHHLDVWVSVEFEDGQVLEGISELNFTDENKTTRVKYNVDAAQQQ